MMYIKEITLQVQEARQNHDDESVKKAVNDYDEALERWVFIYILLIKTVNDYDEAIRG